MTLEQFWTILLKRWQIILICFLVVGLGTLVGSKLMKPVYQASTLVQVEIRSNSNNQSAYSDLQASDQLVQTEADLATSTIVLDEVASHNPGLTAIQLASEVSSTTKLNTQLFEIDVVDESAARAASLANDIAATLIKQQSQATQQNNAQAQQLIQQNLDQTGQQIDNITTQISALQAKGGSQQQVALLRVQLSGLQQRYSQWQGNLAQLVLAQAQSGDFLQVAQPAQPAAKPLRPDVPLYTGVGLLVGLLLGILLALLLERLDTRIRTPEAITRLLGLPVLASVWRAKSPSPSDVINPAGQNANSEAYRILRTNIGFSSIDNPLHSLVVTSAIPRDGKSVIAANLAIFMAKAGKSTLLVDADLRRPSQHTFFNLSPDKLGLSNAVLAFNTPTARRTPSNQQFVPNTPAQRPQNGSSITNLSLEPFVHQAGIPNLWVMPSGPLPPNPSEFLESKVMQRFLSAIAESGIEIVIFDSPPLLGISDASILASKVDGVLVVVDASRARKDKLLQLKTVLSQANVHVLGCVANKLQHKRSDGSYYYYYQVEDQVGGKIQAKNGHIPSGHTAQTISATPVPVESSFEQRIRSN